MEHRELHTNNNSSGWRHLQESDENTKQKKPFGGLLCFRKGLNYDDLSEIFYREKVEISTVHKMTLSVHIICLLMVLAIFAAPYWIIMTFEDTDEELHVGIMMKCHTDIDNRQLNYARPGCSFLWLDGLKGRLPYWVNLARYMVMTSLYLAIVSLVIDITVLIRRREFKWMLVPGVLLLHAGALVLSAVGLVTSQIDDYAFEEFYPTPIVDRGWVLYLAAATGGFLILCSPVSYFARKPAPKVKKEASSEDPPIYDMPPSYIPYHHI